MDDRERITQSQRNILIASSVLTFILVFILGIVVGKNMNLPQRFPSPHAVTGQAARDGDAAEHSHEITSLPTRSRTTSTSPHIVDEGHTFYSLADEPQTDDVPATRTIIEPFRIPAENQGDRQQKTATGEIDSGTPPDQDPYATAIPDFSVAYAIQVSSVANRSYAENSVKNLLQKGYPAYISQIRFSTGRVHYRVRVGPYTTREAADVIMKRIRDEFKTTPLVMTLKNGEL